MNSTPASSSATWIFQTVSAAPRICGEASRRLIIVALAVASRYRRKAPTRRNAIRHGMTAKEIVIPGEDVASYQAFE
jgi:hypothetical protein